jgi:hypothetical protein
VLVDDAPLPPDDLHSGQFATVREPAPVESAPAPALPPVANAAETARVDGHGTNGEALPPESQRQPAGVGAAADRLEEKSG